MSDCQHTTARLTPYVDGALPAEERAEVEHHLGRCAPCRMAAAQEQGGRAVVRDRAARLGAAPPPPGLRARCQAIARAHMAAAAPRPWTARLVPVSLTAILMLFSASAIFSLATHKSNTLLAAQLTIDHSKCFELFVPDDPAPVDAQAMERLLYENHGWDVHVPGSSPEHGVQLIGARRCLYADGRVPHVMYRINGQDVSLYMLEGVKREAADVMAMGHRTQVWSRGATTYVLVSPRTADVTRATQYVMQEAH